MMDGMIFIRSLLAIESLWLDSATVGLRIDPAASDPKTIAKQLRQEEKLFAAWDGERYHYPAFQLLEGAGPHPRIAELINVLPRDSNRTVGLDAVMWVFAPDTAFSGHSPADTFANDPDLVIEEARIRIEGGRD